MAAREIISDYEEMKVKSHQDPDMYRVVYRDDEIKFPRNPTVNQPAPVLSDDIKVAGNVWKNLKHRAMKANYQQQGWFFPLNNE